MYTRKQSDFTRTNEHGVTQQTFFLVIYVYVVVFLVATCTSVYKQAPHQIYLTGGLFVYVYGVVLLVATCTSVYKRGTTTTLF